MATDATAPAPASAPAVGADADRALASVCALGDESRRRMFAFVRNARRPVTRDEAAASMGVSRKLAAFHLDKLVAAGLLRAGYASVDERRRVGRRPKVYQVAETQIRVSIPERSHALLAELLIEGVLAADESSASGRAAQQATIDAARAHGRRLGAAERERDRPGRLGAERGLTHAARTLDQLGFEPAREDGALLLRNCPFHPLTAKAPRLVCGVAHALVAGYLDGLAATSLRAQISPTPGHCCVRLTAPN